MSLRILKSRPKPNLDIARRRKSLNADKNNENEINKSKPYKLSKCEKEVKTQEVSPSSILSDSNSPIIVTSGTDDAKVQANSNIINKDTQFGRSGNHLKITQREEINNKNEDKVEISAKKEIAISEAVSDATQKPDTETKLSTDFGGSTDANSNIINKDTQFGRSGNDLKITQREEINNKNEDKVEISTKKEIVISETVSDITQNTDTERKLSTDVENERKLKVRPKPNIGSINRRKSCIPVSEAEENKTNNFPLEPSESSNGSNPSSAKVARCSKEHLYVISENITEESNSAKKLELKKEGKPVSNCESLPVAVDGPVRKKFCPNLLKSHKTAANILKPLVGSSLSEQKPEKLQLGEEKISNTEPVNHQKSQNYSLNRSTEEVTEKSVESIPPCSETKQLIHRNFKVKVNPKVMRDETGKKTLRVKILIDDSDGKKPNKDVNAEKERKKEDTLNKLIGKDTGDIPDDGIHVSYELDTSDESNISDCKETMTVRDSGAGRVNPLVSSSCRSSRMNNVKPNLATASTRFSPFNQSSYGQMNQDAKQKFKLLYGDRSPERSKMTMKDLIFYNPKNNPISEQGSKNKDLLPETEIIPNSDPNQSHLNSEDSNTLNGDNEIEEKQVNSDGNRAIDQNGVPVPQLKITADGKIIIAPESLVVKTKLDTSEKEWRPLIVENDFTHHKIMKRKSFGVKRNWTFQETLKFYKLLHTTGSDFSTMAQNFPDRTRNCIKRKFKREEKLNGHLIDRVLPGRILTDEEFEAVKKELAVNKMWEEIEKCSRRKSDLFPDIPDISQGITDDMFLSVKEKKDIRRKGQSKASAKPVNILVDGVSNLTKTNNAKSKSTKCKPRAKRKVLRLKEYFSNKEDTPPTVQASINSLIKNRVLQISKNDSENRSASDDEVMNVDEDVSVNKPIVVNTSIESSGIKYTKSITFNPSNLDNPVDINETISHNVQEYPSPTHIIDEIVNILSSDGQSPTVHKLENGNYYNGSRNNSEISESESVDVLNETIEK